LELNQTKITHLGSKYALFLGYHIHVPSKKVQESTRGNFILEKTKREVKRRKPIGKPKLLVSKTLIKNRLIQRGFANSNGRPKYQGKYINLTIQEIIQRYNSVLRGIMNFYNMAENRSCLNEANYILEYSLAHTLAAKLRLSLRKVFIKFGSPIKFKTGVFRYDKPLSLSAEYLDTKYHKFRL